jgi:hypothetical protein
VAKFTDWYLVEAESQLRGRLRQDRLHEVLSEAEGHLRDATQDLVAKGMAEEDAELAAIQRFGRVHAFTNEVLSPVARPLPTRLIVAGAFVMTSITAICGAISMSGLRIGMEAQQSVGILVAIGALLLLAGSWSSRRWRGRLVALSCLAGVLFGFIVSVPVGSWAMGEARSNWVTEGRLGAKHLETLAEKVRRGQTAFASGNPQLLQEFTDRGRYEVPYTVRQGGMIMPQAAPPNQWREYTMGSIFSRLQVYYSSVEKLDSAKYLWKTQADGIVQTLESIRVEALDQANPNPTRARNMVETSTGLRVAAMGTLSSAYGLVFALLLHGLVAICAVRRSWLRRKLA